MSIVVLSMFFGNGLFLIVIISNFKVILDGNEMSTCIAIGGGGAQLAACITYDVNGFAAVTGFMTADGVLWW